MGCLSVRWNVPERSGCTIMGYIQGHDGAAITKSDVSSIAYTVIDVRRPSVTVESGALTVGTVVYDTLQTDARWTKDSTGYNFAWAAPVTIVPEGGKTYQVEIEFTPASGAVYRYMVLLETCEFYG